jgi:hypothetical protein
MSGSSCVSVDVIQPALRKTRGLGLTETKIYHWKATELIMGPRNKRRIQNHGFMEDAWFGSSRWLKTVNI